MLHRGTQEDKKISIKGIGGYRNVTKVLNIYKKNIYNLKKNSNQLFVLDLS